MSIHINFHKFMHGSEAKITLNTNNLFKQQFLMHPDEVLNKMCVVEYSY
jgi:hypothetical protein